MASLVTLDVLRQVEAVPSDQEAKWTRWTASASNWVRHRIGFEPLEASYAHRLSGEGRSLLTLAAWPITQVTSLVVGGVAWTVLSSTTATDSNELAYFGRNARFLEARFGAVFPEGAGNIYAAYKAGWATLPDDLVDLTINVSRLIGKEEAHLGQGAVILAAEQVNDILRNSSAYEIFMQTIGAYRLIG